MNGGPKFKMGNVRNYTLFRDGFVLGGVGLATINLCTKFEISTFTHYKDMKGDKNAKMRVVWGVMGHPRSSAT